ncbi:hypothetical protein SASPL_138431 [Salvia splendens]|uniref:F-box domain-containing protein n=1 Tax=Salvia splendens TaxID=180675 RepID=A0A8X8WV61_SALSN|nr:hypothetical protein SASPL_138431 [Salvia splendens]
MGASLSNLGENGSGSGGPGLGDIPESCVACVFLYLSPPEICNLARLNRAFRGAASSDAVWEAKLPSNYHHLLQLLSQPALCENLSRKDIFAFLARPNLFDDANKACFRCICAFSTLIFLLMSAYFFSCSADFYYYMLGEFAWQYQQRECPSLASTTGDIGIGFLPKNPDNIADVYQLMPEETILEYANCWLYCILTKSTDSYAQLFLYGKGSGIWDMRYHSLFNVVAYLQQIWWFEVDGSVTFPFPPDVYTLSFRIHLGRFSRRLGRRISHFDHTHGWDVKPVRFVLSTSGGQHASSECFLDNIPEDDANGSYKRGCWIEYKVGQFLVKESDPPTEVRFSMKQIDCTHSKGGLCVDSVSIMPSELKERRSERTLQ